ncbi:glycoside hydrolase family 5 protein [Cerasicoccus fimbriatus]|uniref:glycoside hydrolase family 5 protein n=1 Tax=Cerasicoccus fimbriatus TaxID=3014554 RepID=UPI0022B35E4E|nr:cellulase family glycosylhydrolase [Cerasicoccus sp. TK19100]
MSDINLHRLTLFCSMICCLIGFNQLSAEQQPTTSNIQKVLFEEDFQGGGASGDWPSKDEISLVYEDGNRFLRLKSIVPGKMVMAYKEIAIEPGVEAIRFTWNERVDGLVKGEKSWFDARIMMEFMDADRGKLSIKPPNPRNSKDTGGWVENSLEFNVPAGAHVIKFMPALFNVKAGTYDIDNISFQQIPKIPKEEDPAYQKRQKALEEVRQRREKAGKTLEEHGSLIVNGDFQTDSNSDGKPDHWGKAKGGISYPTEGENTFMRIESDKPGEMVMYYTKIDIPEGVEALELSWDWRTSNLKPGLQAWHDARIMMKLLDSSGKKTDTQPSAPYTRKNREEWRSYSRQFLVTEDALTLEFMPTLFEVERGTMDLDNIQLKPIEAGVLKEKIAEKKAQKERMHVDAELANKDNWPSELHVSGNRLVDSEGNDVWLQGVNVASLEWNQYGENVLKSTQVAIEEWGANVIRLPVKESYWFGPQGEQYKELINDVITFAANRGAYVVLDLHRYRAPKPEYVLFWQDAATIYKNHPAVIFDLLNEPHSTSWEVWRNGGDIGKKTKQADEDAFLTEQEKEKNAKAFESVGMQGLVDAVRGVGANNVVVVGGLDWAYDLSGVLNGFAIDDTPEGNGIMYSTHVYPWKKGWQRKFLEVAEKYPILVGEVGADVNKMNWMPHDAQEDAETWVPDMIGLIQKYKLNWTAWCFHPKASPRMLLDWDYTPTPFWGEPVKEAFEGKQFSVDKLR